MIKNLFRGLIGVWLLSGMSSVFALDVVLKVNAAEKARCTYSSVAFGADGTMTVACSGDVMCPSCGSAALASQTITFNAAPTVTVGNTGMVSATATSQLLVTFKSTTETICTVSGSTVSGIAVGTCSIAANQKGDSQYSAAPQATQSFNITANTGNSDCANVPVLDSSRIKNINLDTNEGGAHMLIDAPDPSGYAVVAFGFTTASNRYGKADFSFEDYVDTTGTGVFSGKLLGLSICPGDFDGKGVLAGSSSACHIQTTSGAGGIYYEVGTINPKLCKLETGRRYYLNVKNPVANSKMRFNLTAGQALNTSP